MRYPPIMLFSTLLVMLAGACHADMTIVREGKPAATIVIAAEHSKTEEWCAGELQTWIGKITGARLSIVTDDKPVTGNVLAVGPSRYTTSLYKRSYKFEEYVIKSLSPTCLAFAGWQDKPGVNAKGEWIRDQERGPLYAVYEFLEDQGVRWFYPGNWGWYAPHKSTLTVRSYNVDKTPANYFRWGINGGASPDKQWNQDVAEWAVRSRLNTWMWGAADKGGYIQVAYGGHDFYQFVPADPYFKLHPDWFPLINGQRVPEGQLCLSNPGVVQRFADVAEGSFAADSACKFFAIWPNDSGSGWCECDKCKAMDGPNGNIADRLVKFTNQVAQIVKQDYPDRIFYCAAYTPAYFDPPTTVKPDPNVWVQICRYWPVGDSSSTYYNQMTIQAKHYYSALKRWTELGNVFLYTYYGFFGSDLYYPITYQLFADWPVKTKWGVRGGYSQTSQHWATNAWVYYTYPRVMFDPTIDQTKFREDYFGKCYGRGGAAMRAFFETIENRFKVTPCFLEWETVEGLLTPQIMAQMERHLTAAEQATANADWRTKARVQVVRDGFEYAKQYVGFRDLFSQTMAGDLTKRDATIQAYEAVMAMRRPLEARGLLGANEHNFDNELRMLKLNLTDLPVGPVDYSDYYKQGGFIKLHARESTFPVEYWGLQLPAGGTGHITYEVGSNMGLWDELKFTFLVDGSPAPNALVEVSVDGGSAWQQATETLDKGKRTGMWDVSAFVKGRPSALVRCTGRNTTDKTGYALITMAMQGNIVAK